MEVAGATRNVEQHVAVRRCCRRNRLPAANGMRTARSGCYRQRKTGLLGVVQRAAMAGWGTKTKVLIVENEGNLRDTLCRYFEHVGLEVFGASDVASVPADAGVRLTSPNTICLEN